MPIKKNESRGANENVTSLYFGTGDIAIAAGFESENEKIRSVWFGDAPPRPVSEFEKEEFVPNGNSDGMINPVVMYFTIPESIDQVIYQLQKCRQELIEALKT